MLVLALIFTLKLLDGHVCSSHNNLLIKHKDERLFSATLLHAHLFRGSSRPCISSTSRGLGKSRGELILSRVLHGSCKERGLDQRLGWERIAKNTL